ncbi:nucleotide-binding protein, partial [Flavobacterium sp. UBA5153]
MKRKIFIGSSSEGIKIANQVKDQINLELGDWIECETWENGGVFSLNKGTLESLVKASRKYDYGIMLASKDDILIKRMKIFNVMRDNVLFEMGLFLGSLGLQRAFLITHDKTSLPSDFNGVTIVKYNDKNISDKIANVILEIKKTKESFNLKPV